MTVCIASFCEGKKRIVTVADSKGSYGDYSADDLLLKVQRLSKNWYAMFSGDDITDIPFVLEGAQGVLRDQEGATPLEVANIVHDALRARLHRQIESKILVRFGWSLDKFLQDGKSLLTDGKFDELCDKVMAVKLPMQVLVVGFDQYGDGHIFQIDADRSPECHDPVGFYAIGSGHFAAMSSLLYRANRTDITAYSPIRESIYCCCEAKFMAESASDVGRATFLTILEGNKPPSFIAPHRIEHEIRPAWERYGAPRMHHASMAKIENMTFSLSEKGAWENFVGDTRKLPKGVRQNYMDQFRTLRRCFDLTDSEDLPSRQSPTDDSSPPPPSQESPGE